MPYSHSINSYPDVRQLFEKALESPKGLQLTFDHENQATSTAGRFNAFRIRDRKENEKIYPADHMMHGRSAFDSLMIQRKGNVVTIRKLDINQFNIQEL